ncbi:MAG TPA: hypothetical protein VJ793_27325 [Anaerolineae bacterium]|nr:hypothetical protein [Anaerolineae bacterium]
MGDHRAHIKVELSMYGQTRVYDANTGWHDGQSEEVARWLEDTRRELYETVYAVMIREAEREREAREEREQYERLKAKFEGE